MSVYVLLALILSQSVFGNPTPRISHAVMKPSRHVSQPHRNFWFKSSHRRANEFNDFKTHLLSLNDRDEIYRKIVSSFQILSFSEDQYCKLLQDLDDAKKIFIHTSCYKESPWNHTSLVFEATKCDLATIVGFLIKEHNVNLIGFDTWQKSLTHYCKSKTVAQLILDEKPYLINAGDLKSRTPLFTIPTELIPYYIERGADVDMYASIDYVVGCYHRNRLREMYNEQQKDPENLLNEPFRSFHDSYQSSDYYVGEKLLYTKLTPLMKSVVDSDYARFKMLFEFTSNQSLKKQMRSLKLIAALQRAECNDFVSAYRIEKTLKFVDWICGFSS